MNTTLAVSVRAARQALGISQEELAKAAGISRATVNLIENGQGDPQLSTLVSLAAALRTSVVFLLLGERDLQNLASLVNGENAAVVQRISKKMEPKVAEINRLLGSGIARGRKRAIAMVVKEVKALGSRASVPGAAIGTVLYPGKGTALGAVLGAG
jgi:transcriptional regulator with XRE-family HTH domain